MYYIVYYSKNKRHNILFLGKPENPINEKKIINFPLE
jgi:hypothetical protein